MKCEKNQFNCPVEATLSLIGGKYKPLILWHLIDHPLHYMELQRLISNATPKMLSQQLHDLENNGMIHREVIPEKPPKTVYSLTPFGQSTATLLFYRNKLKKPLTELKAASEMISNNNLDFSIKYDSKDELGELCSSFETMRFTLANNFSEMWRQMEERKQLNAAFAHDLRTPLTVLKGYNEILQSNHDPITKSTAATMRKHIFRLERYVDSMSHLRRLEDAQPISDKSNISGYVTAIADSARILCEQSGKTLSIQNNISDIPIGIDYTFVSQVNNNLISNAIRYATSKVNITYTSNNDGFYLSVSDNGCGFSKNILSKATNPYFTEEENHSEHFGLGLYICKILCEHHGGYLKIENCSIGAKVTAFFKSLD